MKAPDEIKKAVRLCILGEGCDNCPYLEDVRCCTMLMLDVFACIEQLEAENKKARLAAEQIESDQISFDKISDSIVTDRLRKTNIDEMTDSELRDFVKDLLKYV